MITFWIICALMVLLAFWFVLPALLQPEPRQQQSRDASVLIYQDQYQELESDLKNGLIGEAQCEKEKQQLERRLLEEVTMQKDVPVKSRSKLARNVAYGIAIGIPIAAILFYFAVGNPKSLENISSKPDNVLTR